MRRKPSSQAPSTHTPRRDTLTQLETGHTWHREGPPAGHGEGDGQVEDPRSLPGDLEPQIRSPFLGNDAGGEGVAVSSPCLRLEDKLLKA